MGRVLTAADEAIGQQKERRGMQITLPKEKGGKKNGKNRYFFCDS